MKIAALIPARKGSKRLPGKNKLDIDGDYIINKVLRNIRNCSSDIDIYISSDDEDFMNLVDDNDISFLERDSLFCDDFSTVTDLTKWHFTKDLQEYDLVIQTFCHSICVSGNDYDEALKLLIKSRKNSLLTISKLDGPVEWTFKIFENNLIPNFPKKKSSRSQDLGNSYIDSGQFYIYKRKWFDNDNTEEYDEDSNWIELAHFQSNDLDEESDLRKLKINYKVAKDFISDLE